MSGLENKLIKSLRKSNFYELKALNNPEDALMAVLARQCSRANYVILTRLRMQEQITFALHAEVESLEAQIPTLIEQRIEENERKAALSASFSINPAHFSNDLMERMERKIEAREADALKKYEPRKLSEEEERAAAFAAKICDIVLDYNKRWNAGVETVTNLCIGADPDIGRAHKRLIKHLTGAQCLASASQHEEDRLDDLIKRNYLVLEKTQTLSQAKELWVDVAQGATELQESISKLKIKNLVLQQTLYRIEAIVRRLDMLKLLIAALPNSHKYSSIQQYRKLTNALCKYLNEMMKQNKPPTLANEPINFAERLSALEDSTLMAFIQIAKNNSKKLSQNAYAKLERDITAVAKSIETERISALSEFEKWNTLANEAFQDQRELTHAVASQRSDQSAAILKMTEQTLDVLSVTISIAEQRTRKSKAG
ncbi:MAG: hypothetical protein HYX67_09325 [Candidatus Melainabacteria bacterium]|nr:hypothetical protein [Candidatus Melainabacteria bacterium]